MQHTLRISPTGHAEPQPVPTGPHLRVRLADWSHRAWGKAGVAEDFEACWTYSPAMQLGSMGSACPASTSQELAPLIWGSRDVVTAALVGRMSPESHRHTGPAPNLSPQGCLQTAGPSLPSTETQAGTVPGWSSPAPPRPAEPSRAHSPWGSSAPRAARAASPTREGVSRAGARGWLQREQPRWEAPGIRGASHTPLQ